MRWGKHTLVDKSYCHLCSHRQSRIVPNFVDPYIYEFLCNATLSDTTGYVLCSKRNLKGNCKLFYKNKPY